MMKKPMPAKKGVMPAGMYADGGKVKAKPFGGKESMAEEKAEMKKPMKKMADGGVVKATGVISRKTAPTPAKPAGTHGPGVSSRKPGAK